jgi:hypothetical protein
VNVFVWLTTTSRDIAALPEPRDSKLLGLALLCAAVFGSVEVGRGRWWPGRYVDRRRTFSRLLLVALNIFAVVMLVPVLDAQVTRSQAERWYGSSSAGPENIPGLSSDGRIVANVFAYDAEGKPLSGVQLFDQTGRPLDVDVEWTGTYRTADGQVTQYPWYHGGQELWNVFPLPVREQAGWRRPHDAWLSPTPPQLPQPPLRVVPRAQLPRTDAAEPSTR